MMTTIAEVEELTVYATATGFFWIIIILAFAVVAAVLLVVWLWFRLQRQKP